MLKSASDLLEAAPDAMIAIHKDGTIRFANGQAEAVFGYTKDAIMGQAIEVLIPERLRHSHPSHMGAFFAAPKARPMGAGLSLLARHRDGSEFAIEVSLSPVVINGEDFVMAAVRDITERKRLEKTVEATRMQMIASSRLSALGEMAGGIAHEINNPLAVIHALASDLAEQSDATPEEIARCGQRIAQYADRIGKIITSLRNMARDGEQDPFHEASVSEIVDQTMDLCKERFRQHAVDLSTSPIDATMRIPCREVQISQMLVNLLQNAFDAVQDQTGEKWVRLEVMAKGDRVILSVVDSGKGVAPELKARIMEPFFTTKPVGKGTGLGLSLSKQIAEEHGGLLEVGENGGHTCFSLSLPISRETRLICN
jgi:PAS domain S-box-containing protein